MQLRKQLLACILVLLLIAAFIPAAAAESDRTFVDLSDEGDYVLRIDGGFVSEHTETVNGKECLRVDLFLDGVTNKRLVSSISFKLGFDPEQLTFEKSKGLSGSGLMNVINPNEPGLIQYAFASTNGTMLSGTTPLLTLWFTVAEDLPDGTQIGFEVTEPIKADSIAAGSYASQKRSVSTDFSPFIVGSIFYGDANCDGRVTAADAAHVLRALTGLTTLTDEGLQNALVDGTDTLNTEDAALILRYVVKLVKRFPVQA